MNHLEIRHLRMICTIAETGSMTNAAQKLFITQSALSQQLKDIESKLKVDLFFRTRKKMILTPIGKNLLDTAQQVITAVEDKELEIARIVSGERGELKVGTQCIFCYKWLPEVMRQFQNKFPKVEIEIGNAGNLAEELAAKRYDLIITGAAAGDDNYDCLPLFSDQLVCIMPPDHPLISRSWVELDDFQRFNFISYAERAQNRFCQLYLKPRGVEPKRMMTVGHPLAIIEMVASGFGLSVFPRWVVQSTLERDGISARPITRKGLPLTWQAAFLKNSQLPIFQKEFINIVGRMHIENQPAPAALKVAGR
jgi:LysR family transcriptional regulator for metE and metH